MAHPVRSLATLLLAVGLATCSDSSITGVKTDPTPKAITGRITVMPAFSTTAAYVAQHAADFPTLRYDSVHVVIRGNPDLTTLVKDTMVFVDMSAPVMPLNFTVPVASDGQRFNASVDFRRGTDVIFHGSSIVQSYPASGTPTTATLAIDYVGPGANLRTIAVTPKTSVLNGVASTTLSVTAQDSAGASVSVPPLSWTSSDASLVTVTSTGSSTASVQARSRRGSATITVATPTGPSDNATFTVTLPPSAIVVVSGAGQTGTAGAALANPVVVQVNAADGLGISGVSVTFSASPGGSVGTTTATTNASGQATTTLTLGGAAGQQSFSATSAGLSTGIAATATAGDPAAVTVVSGNGQSDSVHATLALAVKVTDSFGNPIGGAAVTWARAGGAGSLSTPLSTTNTDGVATNGYTLGGAIGAEMVTAIAGGVSVSFSLTATSGGPSTIAGVSGSGQSARIGQPLGNPLVVRVTDAGGNPVRDVALAWTTVGGTVTSTTRTDATGQASALMTLGSAVGSASATARLANGQSVTFAVTAIAGSPSATTFTTQPVAAISGQLMPSVRVTLRDSVNNLTTGTNSITLSLGPNPNGATLFGTLTRAAIDGVATFDDLKLDRAGGGYTLVASGTGLAGATSIAFDVSAGAASALTMLAGNGQSATVNSSVATAPAVKVTDASNNPIGGVLVAFTPASGSGSVTPTGGAVTTNASGVATIGSWTLGTTAGPNSLTAMVGALTPVTFTAVGVAGSAASVAKLAGDAQTAAAGTPVATAPAISVSDAFGNHVSGVSVTFAVAGGGGSITGETVTTNAGGVATLGSWTLGNAAGANSLTVSVGALSPVTFTATGTASSAANVAKSSGDAQTANAGSAVATPPAVTVTDSHGNAVAGAAVTFAIASGTGTITGGAATTNASGVATVGTWTLGNTAGPNSITATVAALAPVTFTATGTAGAPASVAKVAGDAQSSSAGSAVAVAPAVTVTDSHGNAVAGAAVTFAVASGGGTVTGVSATTNASGVATVGSWTLGNTAGGNTLTATVGALAPVAFTAAGTASAAANIVKTSGDAQSSSAGAAVAIAPAVAVTDPHGNAVSGVLVTFAVASGGGTVTGATATTTASGVATVGSWSLGNTAGANTLTATVDALTPVTFMATGTAGPAANLAKVAGDAQSSSAGGMVAIAPAVAVTDSHGNALSGVTVTFAVASGSGSVTGGTATTNASGVATVGSWTVGNTAGGNTLVATVGALAPVTFTATGTAGAAANVVKSSGDAQSANAGSAIATAPAVRVTDSHGNAVAGATVTFAVTAGGGNITGGTATTDASGIAIAGSWTLGNNAGTNSLTATVDALAPVTFTATGTAGTAANLAKVAGDAQSSSAGAAVAIAPAVAVTDSHGNAVAGATVTFVVASGGGSVTGGAATTNASGVATIGSWTLGNTAGANVLTATVGALSPLTFTATGTPSAAANVAKSSGDTQSANAGSAVATPPAVTVTDSHGNAVAGVTVTFTVTAGGGNITGGTATTNGSGLASVGSWTLGNTAGANSLTATVGALSPVTFSATGTPGAAANVAKVAGDAQSSSAGAPVTTAPAVAVTDAHGNAVSGVTVTFAVASGGGSISGGTATTNASGVATVGSWTLGNIAGANSLTATVGALTPAIFTATGAASAAANVVKSSGDAQTATVGSALATAPAVTVTDALGNAVSGAVVTFAISSGAGSITAGTATTNTSGVATIGSWTVGNIAGANSLTATVGALVPVTFTATGVAGAATNVVKTAGDAQSAAAGAAVATAPSITVSDAFGNRVNGVSVTFAVAGGGGTITGATTTTNASGGATLGSWTLGNTVGANTLTATAGALSPVTFTATGTASTPANVAKSSGDAQTANAGNAVPTAPAVTVTDSHGNPVPGATVTFAVASGAGSVTGGTATTNTSGIATVGSWTLGNSAGANTLTATVAALAPVTFTATGVAGGAALAERASNAAVSTSVGSALAAGAYPSVRVRDANGNPVPAASGVTLAFTVTAGSCSVAGAAAVAVDATGQAALNATSLSLPGSAGSCVVHAVPSAPSGTSFDFYVVVGPSTGGNNWLGGTDGSFTRDANWSRGVAPTDTSAVFIPRYAPNAPALQSSSLIRAISMETSSILDVANGNTLSVKGTIDAATIAHGTVNGTGASGSSVRGTFTTLTLGDGTNSCTYVVNGGLTTSGDVLLKNCDVNDNGQTLAVGGDLRVSGANGNLAMLNSLGRVVVAGAASFAGASTVGQLTNGTLEVGGAFTQWDSVSVNSFVASGAHVTKFTGTGSQNITFTNPASSHFYDLNVTNQSAGGVIIRSIVAVTHDFTIGASGMLSGTAGGGGTRLIVDGAVTASSTSNLGGLDSLRVTGPAFPLYNNSTAGKAPRVTDISGAATMSSNVTVAGGLSVRGSLDINGRALTILDSLNITGVVNALNTTGRINLRGNFREDGASPAAFAPTPGFKVTLNGSSSQSISFAHANATQSFFTDLTVQNTSASGAAFATAGFIKGALLVDNNAVLKSNSGITVTATGAVTGNSGSKLAGVQELVVNGTAFPLFGGTNGPVKTTIAHGMTMIADATLTGALSVQDFLVLGGHKLTVGGDFAVENAGLLKVQNTADSLVINGNATFNGGSQDDFPFSAGAFDFKGDFTAQGAKTFYSGAFTGNTVRFTRSSAQAVSVSGTSNYFANVVITNASTGGVLFASDVGIFGALTQKGKLTINSSTATQVQGTTNFGQFPSFVNNTVINGALSLATTNIYSGSSISGTGLLGVGGCQKGSTISISGIHILTQAGNPFVASTCEAGTSLP